MFFFVMARVLGFARLLAAGPVSEDFEESLGGLREASRARLFSAGREMLLDLVVQRARKKPLALGPREVNRRSRALSVKP